RRAPPELARGARAGDLGAAEVAGTALGVEDVRVADDLGDRRRQLQDRHRLPAREVVDAVACSGAERERDAARDVPDVGEAARLAPAAGDRERPPGERV